MMAPWGHLTSFSKKPKGTWLNVKNMSMSKIEYQLVAQRFLCVN